MYGALLNSTTKERIVLELPVGAVVGSHINGFMVQWVHELASECHEYHDEAMTGFENYEYELHTREEPSADCSCPLASEGF